MSHPTEPDNIQVKNSIYSRFENFIQAEKMRSDSPFRHKLLDLIEREVKGSWLTMVVEAKKEMMK